jgi:hypothetical protein
MPKLLRLYAVPPARRQASLYKELSAARLVILERINLGLRLGRPTEVVLRDSG